jgi:hypothetical protein
MPKIPGEHRPAKLPRAKALSKEVFKAELAAVEAKNPPKQRKCCATPTGEGPHGPECKHHPKNRKPRQNKLAKWEAQQRWPAGTVIQCVWDGREWTLSVAPGDGLVKKHVGTGIHPLLSRAYQAWKASQKDVAKTDEKP